MVICRDFSWCLRQLKKAKNGFQLNVCLIPLSFPECSVDQSEASLAHVDQSEASLAHVDQSETSLASVDQSEASLAHVDQSEAMMLR